MSQHDFTIANQTAQAARTDINSALQALASNNSNTTAPATTYANQWWYSTANNTLYLRNEANTGWIIVGVLDQANSSFSPQNAVPVGAVNPFAMSSPPTGWLACDGSDVSRTSYPQLFSAIGTVYGSGNGSTTFNLPDLRGEFVRGWDASRGVDTGRTFGTSQLDQMQRITGTATTGSEHFNLGVRTGALNNRSVSGARNAQIGYGNVYGLTFDSADSPDARVSSTTAGETRSRNVALLYCVKY